MPNTCGAKVLEEVEAEVVGNVRELDRDGGDGARRPQHLVGVRVRARARARARVRARVRVRVRVRVMVRGRTRHEQRLRAEDGVQHPEEAVGQQVLGEPDAPG